jgi:hypothetical protein
MWRWARIRIAGQRFLGLYGQDEYGWIFHAVIDLAQIGDHAIATAAAEVGYAAFAMWRLGAHESISIDQRLPPQVQDLNRAAYDTATPEQTVVLFLTPAEIAAFGLPEMMQ